MHKYYIKNRGENKMEKAITNSKLLSGWTLKLEQADKLPQDLATAFAKLYGTKLGGSYTPRTTLAHKLSTVLITSLLLNLLNS